LIREECHNQWAILIPLSQVGKPIGVTGDETMPRPGFQHQHAIVAFLFDLPMFFLSATFAERCRHMHGKAFGRGENRDSIGPLVYQVQPEIRIKKKEHEANIFNSK
jgi:hypothetical protein